MLAKLLHKLGVGPPPKPEDHARDPRWEPFIKHLLVGKVCEVCGTTDDLEGHHIVPFHENRALELDPANIAVLCMKPGHWCHFVWGHRWNWKKWVSNLRKVLVWMRMNVEVKGG